MPKDGWFACVWISRSWIWCPQLIKGSFLLFVVAYNLRRKNDRLISKQIIRGDNFHSLSFIHFLFFLSCIHFSFFLNPYFSFFLISFFPSFLRSLLTFFFFSSSIPSFAFLIIRLSFFIPHSHFYRFSFLPSTTILSLTSNDYSLIFRLLSFSPLLASSNCLLLWFLTDRTTRVTCFFFSERTCCQKYNRVFFHSHFFSNYTLTCGGPFCVDEFSLISWPLSGRGCSDPVMRGKLN